MIGHEFVGEVVAAGDDVTEVAVGDRVLGTYGTACGECFFCRRGEFHKCDEARVFGHGAALGSLQGAQAELVLVPHANLTLRKVPDGLADDVALFAGDVMGTGYHAVARGRSAEGDDRRDARPGPGRPLRGAGGEGGRRLRGDRRSTPSRTAWRWPSPSAPTPVHLTEEDPRGEVKKLTEGRGVDLAVEAVGHPEALDLALRLARKAGTVSVTGVYAERTEVHMGVIWIKALTLTSGHANVIKHLDPVLELLSDGKLDPAPLVTHHMKLDEAPDAYRVYDNREALKIVLAP